MITLKGPGVHSGISCTVHLHRTSGAPVAFRRGRSLIPALISHVTDTRRATTLSKSGENVRMVEHLLAALHLSGWWRGLLIEVSQPELPVLDGSASEWLAALTELGQPPEPPAALEPAATVSVNAAGGSASVTPGEDRLSCLISFDHPLIGRQEWQGSPAEYRQLADARTFGFAADFERLQADGQARGATRENCVVFTADGTLAPLRGADEPVRHKALDALGDLFLLGQPLRGSVSTACGSHTLHATLVRELRREAGLENAA